MNLLRDAPIWAQILLMVLLVAAAAQDVVQRRISNWLCLAVIVAAVAAAIAAGPTFALWQNAVVFAAVLGVSIPLFAAGWLGGGDVKLLAAVSLWVGLAAILPLLAIILMSGGVIALASLALRNTQARKTSKGVPYGVAIALGAGILVARPTLFQSAPERPDPLDLHAARSPALRR